MTPENPWRDLKAPSSETAIAARRVDEALKWDFFWGRDSERHCLLVLRHDGGVPRGTRLPRLRGIEVLTHVVSGERPALIIRLLDSSLLDVFSRLCLDIVSASSHAASEQEAVQLAIARTWRWHHMLRGGGSGLLTAEEQKGLLGEMAVLERYFLDTLPAAKAIAAWRGPLGKV
jgi:hypothetical protein